MSLRRIARSTVVLVHGVAHEARVYRDSEWNEYRVRIYSDGKLNAEADYHCTDKQEAHDTMQAYESNWLKAATTPRPMPARAPETETVTYTVKTKEDFAALHLSYYTLCKLADQTRCVYPHLALPASIERGNYKGLLTLDKLGNYVNFI